MALATITRTAPTSWDDDLDWDNIDVGDVRYLQALQYAVAERCSTVTGKSELASLRTAWMATPSGTSECNTSVWGDSRAQATAIEVAIMNLAEHFIIPLDYGDYAEDLSDFPKFWSFDKLLQVTEGALGPHPSCGVPMYESKQYLKTLKEMLSLLYLTRVETYSYYNYAYAHASTGTMTETLEEAMSTAESKITSRSWSRSRLRSTSSGAHYSFHCYTTCEVYGGIDSSERQRLYYNCEIWDYGWKLEALFGSEGLKPNILLFLWLGAPERLGTSEQLCDVVFDPVDTGLEEGISTLSFPYGSTDVTIHGIGSNPTPPEPTQEGWQEESDGTPYMNSSYSVRGFQANVYPCFDHRECFKFK